MIVALIGARGGSKGIPRKNLIDLDGYPLIAYSIAVALKCPSIDRVVVSTDDEEIAEVSKKYGAEVLIRPGKYATDSSSDYKFVEHYLKGVEDNNEVPEYIVHLRPTTPLRDIKIIEEAIDFMQLRKQAREAVEVDYPDASWFTDETALRSIHKLREPPEKLFRADRHGWLEPLISNRELILQKEYYNQPRQAFDPAWQPNGYVDIIKPETLNKGVLHGDNIWGFETPDTSEVDTKEDLEFIEFKLTKQKFDSRELLRSF